MRMRGSVFPAATAVALPCAVATYLLKAAEQENFIHLEWGGSNMLKDTSLWNNFMTLVGFLIVFRTSQAYSRFWDGCTAAFRMRSEWFDACGSLVSFCKYTTAGPKQVHEFQNLLVRLFSMMHAVALADLEKSSPEKVQEEKVFAFKYKLIDPAGLDNKSLHALKNCDAKVELLFQWIQQLIVENINTGVLTIPAPLLSRAFQEIASGMVQFYDAVKISAVPFPFPYAQTCNALLVIHWAITPMVVAQGVTTAPWGALFSFIQVFIFWCLNLIALEIEHPFGKDANDLDTEGMQEEFNKHLLLTIHEETLSTPTLAEPDKKEDFKYLWSRSCGLQTAWSGVPPPSKSCTSVDSQGCSTRCSTCFLSNPQEVDNRTASTRSSACFLSGSGESDCGFISPRAPKDEFMVGLTQDFTPQVSPGSPRSVGDMVEADLERGQTIKVSSMWRSSSQPLPPREGVQPGDLDRTAWRGMSMPIPAGSADEGGEEHQDNGLTPRHSPSDSGSDAHRPCVQGCPVGTEGSPHVKEEMLSHSCIVGKPVPMLMEVIQTRSLAAPPGSSHAKVYGRASPSPRQEGLSPRRTATMPAAFDGEGHAPVEKPAASMSASTRPRKTKSPRKYASGFTPAPPLMRKPHPEPEVVPL